MGIETDARITADGEIALVHDSDIRRWPWLPGVILGRSVSRQRRDQLPDHIPTLADYYRRCGSSLPLSIDVKDPAAFSEIMRIARANKAAAKLWICHEDLAVLRQWRRMAPQVRLVHSVNRNRLPRGHERHAADLAQVGVDAANLRRGYWSRGLVALYHRFGVLAFAWDAQQVRHIVELIGMGIDAVYSDHVDRLAEALEHCAGQAG